MSWIALNEMYPPQGLEVLIEASGRLFGANYQGIFDHTFFIASWIIPKHEKEGHWLIYDNCGEGEGHIGCVTVHAWMPLPKHYQQKDMAWEPPEDMMEHAMFEDEPEWLYKGDCVYEQMTLEEFLNG
jgi:hypothetical protein